MQSPSELQQHTSVAAGGMYQLRNPPVGEPPPVLFVTRSVTCSVLKPPEVGCHSCAAGPGQDGLAGASPAVAIAAPVKDGDAMSVVE